MTHDTYSLTSLKPFAIYDPATQSLKTFEDTLALDSTPFLATLPQSGMMQNGVLFELPKSVLPTKEPGFTSLPTPMASDWKNGLPGKGTSFTNLKAQMKLLPTPLTTDGKGTSPADSRRKSPGMRAAKYFDWDKFQPAIERWEKVIGRFAPVPMIDEKLNPEFTEWMMGLPKGWITDVEISWANQIKACGNGVVPQAAKEALARLV